MIPGPLRENSFIAIKRLIQQFETHPNRDSLIKDLNSTEEFNLFSEKSKELITRMERSLLKYNALTCGKCIEPSERNRQLNKARYHVWSITSYVITRNPTHGARHGLSMRQCMYYKAHEMLKKARKHKNGYKNILDRWNNDDKYRKSV